MKRFIIALATVAFAVPAAAQVRDTTVKLDAVVAMVGSTPITVYDIERRLSDSIGAFMRRRASMPDRALQIAMAHSALNDIVDEEVLLVKANEAKIEVSDVEVQAKMDEMMKEQAGNFPSQSAFREALAQAGYGTPEEYRRAMSAAWKRSQIIQQYVRQLASERKLPSVVIPESQVQAEFERWKAAGLPKRAAMVSWRQMVIAPTPSPAEKAAARAKIDSLRAEIKAGGDFERIAKRESMDAATKDLGGDLGWRKRGDLPTELERMLFGQLQIKQGEVSPVVESPYGFHLLRIDRSNPPAEVKVRQILIIPKIDSSDVARARILADRLVGALHRGAVFDTVARLYHDRAEEAPGLIPETIIDSLPPSYQSGLKDVKKDSIVTFPIGTVMGYSKYVIARVASTTEPGDYTYDELKARVRMSLQNVQQMRKYIDQQRKSVYVRIYPERAEEAIRIFQAAAGK
jgi:peptidyl-prolyl cis-trans isomerase SurA